MKKAFLKWAGGKSQSVDFVLNEVGEVNGRFVEPFIGSGVVSLNTPYNCLIADCNTDLIGIYKTLNDYDNFITDLRPYFSGKFNNQENFYSLRDEFNTSESTIGRALLFVYLNRHCFNGLCRYNKSGKFNVPFGKYKSVYFPEKELLSFKEKLQQCTIAHGDFTAVMNMVNSGDVVYCDPPYVPLSTTASFTDYSTGGFSEEQQRLLAKMAEESKAKVLISNHDTEFTRDLYKNATYIKTKEVNRFISAKAEGRKKAHELLAVYDK